MESDELFIGCDCALMEHTARLMYFWPDDGSVYLTVSLERGTFLNRLKTAFRYVFGWKASRYGDYAEIILKPEDVARLQDFLARYEDTLYVERSRENSAARYLYERWEARVNRFLKG